MLKKNNLFPNFSSASHPFHRDQDQTASQYIISQKHLHNPDTAAPCPSLYGADRNLPAGHLVHSTYHQTLSAQSWHVPLIMPARAFTDHWELQYNMYIFQYTSCCAFIPHCTAILWCCFPMQCWYMLVESEAHLTRTIPSGFYYMSSQAQVHHLPATSPLHITVHSLYLANEGILVLLCCGTGKTIFPISDLSHCKK